MAVHSICNLPWETNIERTMEQKVRLTLPIHLLLRLFAHNLLCKYLHLHNRVVTFATITNTIIIKNKRISYRNAIDLHNGRLFR